LFAGGDLSLIGFFYRDIQSMASRAESERQHPSPRMIDPLHILLSGRHQITGACEPMGKHPQVL